MTTAILASNTAQADARTVLSVPSVRALTVFASLAFHAAVAGLAYQRAGQQRFAPLALEVSQPPVEVALITSDEPMAEAEPNHDASARAVGTPRAISVAKLPASPARTVSHTAVANEAPVPANSVAASAAPSGVAAGSVALRTNQAHFTLQAPVVVGGSSAAVVASPGNASAPAEPLPLPEARVDTPAKLQAGSPPEYTAAAAAAGVEAELPLEVVIDAGGAVQSARALERVGYGLDETALAAIRRYRFSPARRAGNAVAVRMRWVMRFQLR